MNAAIEVKKTNVTFGLVIWTCKITDTNGDVYSAKSWNSAKGAYRLAQMRQRVSQHSPAMYDGTTCVHLRNITRRISSIVIYGQERVVYTNALDIGYDDNCYVQSAYGGYR